jgi:serine/threonine protein kinase
MREAISIYIWLRILLREKICVSWQKIQPVTQAINLAIQLCDILASCHSSGIVHRDIKPENCIITSNDKVFLVDFGLAFRAEEDVSFETPIAQEIGNRFLRLPEYHADSVNKADPRTDLTSCIAILFFLITHIDPRVLVDENNRYPPQRGSALKLIREAGIPRVDRLLALFDRAFQSSLDLRFQSAAALRVALSACLIPEGGEQDPDSIASRIRERTNSPLYVQQRSTMEKLYAIQSQIYVLSDKVVGSLGGAFSLVDSSNEANASTGTAIYRVGFSSAQNIQRIFMPNYVLQHLGNEIILKVVIQAPNGDIEEFAARLPANPGTVDAAMLDRLRAYLLGKLEQMLS